MPIKGFVESVSPDEILGWVYDSERPNHHVEIVATIDGRRLGAAVADISRADLAAANVGKGDHGFILKLTPKLSQSELNNLNVAAWRDGQVALKSVPRLRRASKGQPVRHKATAPPLPRDDSQYPVFILGTTRSGTSALSRALLKSGRYAGGGEGHYLELLGALLATVDRYYDAHKKALRPEAGTMLKAIDKHHFSNKIEQIFIELASTTFPNRFWVDKTPSIGMLELSPILLRLWPNSKFIFMKRRGIENVESKGRKFNQPFANRCGEWAAILSTWLTVRENLHNRAIEIDQIDVAIDPTTTANIVAEHVELPKEYLGGLRDSLANDRPELTTAIFPSVLDFSELSWSPEEKQQFLKICGPMMECYGYTYDHKYRKNNPLRLP